MVVTFLEKEERRIIVPTRVSLQRGIDCQDCSTLPGLRTVGEVDQETGHTLRRGHLDTYELWRQEQTDALDKQGETAQPGTINNELSTIGRMEEVALSKGFIDRGQLLISPQKSKGIKGSRIDALPSAQEWVQLEKSARLY